MFEKKQDFLPLCLEPFYSTSLSSPASQLRPLRETWVYFEKYIKFNQYLCRRQLHSQISGRKDLQMENQRRIIGLFSKFGRHPLDSHSRKKDEGRNWGNSKFKAGYKPTSSPAFIKRFVSTQAHMWGRFVFFFFLTWNNNFSVPFVSLKLATGRKMDCERRKQCQTEPLAQNQRFRLVGCFIIIFFCVLMLAKYTQTAALYLLVLTFRSSVGYFLLSWVNSSIWYIFIF